MEQRRVIDSDLKGAILLVYDKTNILCYAIRCPVRKESGFGEFLSGS